MKKNPFFFWSVFFVGFFIFITILAVFDFFIYKDYNISIFLQKIIPQKFDFFFSILSLLGTFEVLSILFFLLIFLTKKYHYFSFYLIFLLSHFIEYLSKRFIFHPEPPTNWLRTYIFFKFPTSHIHPGNSYPSGHSLRSVFLTAVFILTILKSKRRYWQKIFLLITALFLCGLMLVSRISLGEHWFSDVLGGVFLGLSGFFVTRLIFKI